ncbi:MAG: hypothetical protein DRH08_12655 [Deltaproteobacteria bacterium]|nr:MAG: hypothetical protein DRH08_12655 [Deltaproteobacteria bacterium]
MQLFFKLLLIACVSGSLFVTSFSLANANVTPKGINAIDSGYSVLKLLLEDEQHLTVIRRTKMVLTFTRINDTSTTIIDAISTSSEQSLGELETLATKQPKISFSDLSGETIASATLNSLRMATAKEFLFDGDNFEKDLLLSQLKVLPVIIHLAEQLEEKETNIDRKQWLNRLVGQYKEHYLLVNSRISITATDKS